MMRLRSLKCSFCGRNEKEVEKLVAGPRVYICDRCVRAAAEIMATPSGDEPPASTLRSRMFDRLHHFVRATHDRMPPAGKEHRAAI